MQIRLPTPLKKVGIDLGPASRLQQAPGTAVHVSHQLTALFKMEVPWEWIPVAESNQNPLLDLAARWNPSIISGRSYWRRAVFAVGREWRHRRCDLGFATAFFVPMAGIPVVTNFFDGGMFTEDYERSWKTSGKAWNFHLIKTLGHHALWRSLQIYTLSQYWKDFLADRFPTWSDKFVVTPCGVKPPRATRAPNPEWSSNLRRPFFLFAGAFSDNKNQFRLIEVWSRLQAIYPDLPALILPGPCSEEYRESRITPAVSLLPRSEEVILPGVISDDDLAWAFQNALAYLQPSFMEGFGMPIIEAMSYGLPVACSDTTCLPGTAGGASLLFAPDNPGSIGDCVLRLWRDAELRDELSRKGLIRSSNFTWEKNARIVTEQIEHTLSTSQRF